MSVNVCLYNKKHREGLIALWLEAFPNDPPWNEPNIALEEKLKHQPELLFVAEDKSKIVGSVMAGYDGHRGWIYSVAVSLDHREKGTASVLLEKAEKALIKLGCVKVNLQIRSDNYGVQEFYKKNGYSIEDRISMGKKV